MSATEENAMNENNNDNRALGRIRFESDKRQIAGLLMITGFCCIIQPIYNVASLIGADGTTVTSGIPFASLFGGLCLMGTGIMSVLTGFNELVHDTSFHKYCTFFMICFTQTAYIPYITGMVDVGRATTDGMVIPPLYNPTASDHRLAGAMGIMGIMAYGFGLVGSVAFMQFSLYAFQAGKPQDRPRKYYQGRLMFYSFILFLAGLTQLILGAFVIGRFGNELKYGPIVVAFYMINMPGISCTIGALQVLLGIKGMFRSFGLLECKNRMYQMQMGIVWFLALVLQALTQPAYNEGDFGAGNAPNVAAFSFALHLMPAYLEYKARTVPEDITPEYYGLTSVDNLEQPIGTDDDKQVKVGDDKDTGSQEALPGTRQVDV